MIDKNKLAIDVSKKTNDNSRPHFEEVIREGSADIYQPLLKEVGLSARSSFIDSDSQTLAATCDPETLKYLCNSSPTQSKPTSNQMLAPPPQPVQRWNSQPALTHRHSLRAPHDQIKETRLMTTLQAPTPQPAVQVRAGPPKTTNFRHSVGHLQIGKSPQSDLLSSSESLQVPSPCSSPRINPRAVSPFPETLHCYHSDKHPDHNRPTQHLLDRPLLRAQRPPQQRRPGNLLPHFSALFSHLSSPNLRYPHQIHHRRPAHHRRRPNADADRPRNPLRPLRHRRRPPEFPHLAGPAGEFSGDAGVGAAGETGAVTEGVWEL